MTLSVDFQSSLPRSAKCWSRFRSIVENNSPNFYSKRAVAVPLLDDVNSQPQDKLQDRNHIDTSLPSAISTNNYNTDEEKELLF